MTVLARSSQSHVIAIELTYLILNVAEQEKEVQAVSLKIA